MRLRQLSLDLFGKFTGHSYDFGDGASGDFHIIYGPNEAGKTTTMEAALRLLYGFPRSDPYDFQHQRKNLRLSGVLDLDGRDLTLTRVTGKNALTDSNGAPLPEQTLASHLGGLSEKDYRALLCLDDETIETGGEEIAAAKGDIGRLLFSAAAGIADLSHVLTDMRKQADTLHRKRASTTEMARLKKEIAEIDRRIRDSDTSAASLRKLRQTHATAQTTEAQARQTRDALHREVAQIDSLRRALPLMTEGDGLDAALAGKDAFPDRLSFDPERLIKLASAQARAEADLDRLGQALAEAQEARDGLHIDPQAAELADRLAALTELRGRYLSAVPDLPKRRAARDAAVAQMALLARDLGAAGDCDPTSLVLGSADLGRLDAARDRLRQARRDLHTAADETTASQSALDQARSVVDGLATQAPAGSAVADILDRHDADRLAPAYASARAQLRSGRDTVAEALAALGRGACRFDKLPDAPMPLSSAETLVAQREDLAQRAARARDTQLGQSDLAERLAARAAQYHQRGTVSDADATQAQAERDRAWQAHLAALTATTADAFAKTLERTDQLAQARLAQAQDLAELRKTELDRAEALTAARQATRQAEELDRQIAAIDETVAEACVAVGLPALSPAAFADWLRDLEAAAAASRTADRAAAELAPALARAETLRQDLLAHLPQEDPDFEAALDHARTLARDASREAGQRREAEATMRRATEDLATRETRETQAERALTQALEEWRALVGALFDGRIPPDGLEPDLTPLRGLREQETTRALEDRRITAMQDDQTQFATAVSDLARQHALTEDGDDLAVHAALEDRARSATEALRQREELTRRITTLQDDITKARALRTQVDHDLKALAHGLPGVPQPPTLDALRIAETRAREVIAQRARRAEIDRALTTELGTSDRDDLRAMLDGRQMPELDAQLAAVRADLAAAEAQLEQAIADRSAAARDLAAITSDADIARLVEHRSTLELQLEEAALDYLQMDFGLRLAEEAIRRYRDSHRSGMMDATQSAFAALTNGAYTRLVPQTQGTTEVLQVIDAQGAAKQVADLSKGTRFQLYLALRAAAYEQLAASGTVLPFFCDDIFETFDEDRTRAACRLMERIGHSGQAIYLTHHRHVVDIAQEVCSTPPQVHYIQGAP
ncbi:AAA family ATPase [Sagittula sp. SSi028]|uniref:ATP-binding protein n=1 Tax=Sagittula sp. SSi028 TaxID=3400636 RepID=UPI003AF5C90D